MELEQHSGQSSVAARTNSQETASRRPYVLVVDDDPAHRRLMELVADSLIVHITSVHCAIEALKLLAEIDAFELILLDCRMPEVDGFAFAQRYRQFEQSSSRQRVPIIAVTGLCHENTPTRCLQAGMDDYLFKPFELSELKTKIEMIIERSECDTARSASK